MFLQRLGQRLLFLLTYTSILHWSIEAVEGNKKASQQGWVQLIESSLECLRKVRSHLATVRPEPFPTHNWGPNIEGYLLPAIICFCDYGVVYHMDIIDVFITCAFPPSLCMLS